MPKRVSKPKVDCEFERIEFYVVPRNAAEQETFNVDGKYPSSKTLLTADIPSHALLAKRLRSLADWLERQAARSQPTLTSVCR